MVKLLIAVYSDVLAGSIARAIPPDWDVSLCHDGIAAEEFLLQQKPDALILDLRLPYKDGLSVLKDCFPSLPPAILAITDYDPSYVVSAATSYGVSSVIQIPTLIRTIADRITDIVSSLSTPPTIVSRHLDKLGLNSGYDGYKYLLLVIVSAKANPTLRLHKELYAMVMEKWNVNDPRNVERSIRSAIKSAWLKRDPAVWSYYFPSEKYGEKCPNNRSFICRLSEMI